MAYCGQLSKDFARFKTDFDVDREAHRQRPGQVRRVTAVARAVRRPPRAGDRRAARSRTSASSRRAAPRDRRGLELETQRRADPLDRIEVAAVLERQHLAAVREREPDGEVEPVVARLHRRAVERAGRRVERRAAAGGAAERVPAARPPGRAAARPGRRKRPRACPPSPTTRARSCRSPRASARSPRSRARARHCSSNGIDRVVAARPSDACASARRPADDGVRDLGREHLRELGPRLLAADDDDARPAEPAERALRAPRRPSGSARGRGSRCAAGSGACDQPPWSWRPGASSVRSAISSSRPPRSARRGPARGRRRRRARRRRVRAAARAARAGSRRRRVPCRAPDAGSARTLQTLSRPAAKTASPWAPSRSNSPSKNRSSRSKSAFRPLRTSCARSGRVAPCDFAAGVEQRAARASRRRGRSGVALGSRSR